MTGEALLVVDLASDEASPNTPSLTRAISRLGELPCPTLALLSAAPSDATLELSQHFDVVIEPGTELQPILEAIQRTPLAAMALVQLLRQTAKLDIHDGLIVESLVYSTLQSGPEFAAWRAARPTPSTPKTHPEPAVLVRRSAQRLHLTLNRPEKHNAFSAEMRDALAEGLQVALLDPSVAEVVLDGAGPSFCAGGDLDEFGTFPDPATAHGIRSTRNAGRLLAGCAERLRFELHGACVGAGAELPAFGRQVIATRNTFFQLPEVGMGLVPGAGGTVSIPRRIGRQRTAYLALSGLRLDATTAHAWGLVDELREPGS